MSFLSYYIIFDIRTSRNVSNFNLYYEEKPSHMMVISLKSKTKKLILVIILFGIFQSVLISLGSANGLGIYDGLSVDYIINGGSDPDGYLELTITWSDIIANKFQGTWDFTNMTYDTGQWLVDKTTRIVSSLEGPGPPPSEHTYLWIFTNVTSGQNVTLSNPVISYGTIYNGDRNYTVTDCNATHDDMEIFVLEDTEHDSVLRYNKEFGFLVNGTMNYESDWLKFIYVGTNAYKIPGFSLPILIALIGITSLVLLRKFKLKKK